MTIGLSVIPLRGEPRVPLDVPVTRISRGMPIEVIGFGATEAGRPVTRLISLRIMSAPFVVVVCRRAALAGGSMSHAASVRYVESIDSL